MKYPKLRNGPNPTGEALHRALQRTGAPFLSAEGIGYGANKMGNGAEVYSSPGDGFYCLGAVDVNPASPPFKITASDTARGKFFSRGTWDGGAFTTPSLAYVGYGAGIVPTASGTGFSTLSSTRDGKQFRELLTFGWGQDGHSGIAWGVHSGARYTQDGAANWTWGVMLATYSDEEPFWSSAGGYLFTKDKGLTWQQTALSFGQGFFHGLPAMHRLTPATSMMILPTYVVDGASEQWAEQQDPRLSTLVRLDDYGDTFSEIGGGELVGMLQLSVSDPVTASHDQVNDRIQAWVRDTYVLPLADGGVLYLAEARYYDGRYAGGPEADSGMWVFRGGQDTEPVFIGKIAIPGVPTSYAYAIQFGGKPVGFAVPESSTDPVQLIVGATDGSSWTYKPMPYPRHSTGGLLAIDEHTLVCPMYDAERQAYVLKQTRDLGDTWTHRATITKDAPPPEPGDSFLARFGTLTYMRRDGFAAPTFPGAPWMGDDRLTTPWEA
jgi:hypothetical protein